jgi:TPR repeat protein
MDPRAAVARFTCVTEMWRECTEDSRLMAYLSEPDGLPPDAMTLRQAAGGALYLLGYCALYGIGEGEDGRQPSLSTPPAPERVAKAVPLFREAAEIDHVASIVMLGDLYAYGLLVSDTASSEDESLRYYLEAERVSMALAATGEYTRGIALRDPTENAVDAMMSLAARSLAAADYAVDTGAEELARVNAWRSYSDAAAKGSVDALVRMAECLYRGYGTAPNLTAAIRLLRRAQSLDGGRVEAALWLGDSCRGRAWGEEENPAAADEIYLRGLESHCLESECGPYTLGLRRMDRKKRATTLRAELHYRLATLRAVHFSDTAIRKESFSHLAEAILMGHTAAVDDLARIFEYENNRPRNVSRKAERRKRRWLHRFGRRATLRRRVQENGGLMSRNSRALRIHQEWLSDYYTALYPEPKPFAYRMEATVIPSDIPDYVKAPVTDIMRANALQYLGECFYEGYGLPSDMVAAVACYRRVLEYAPKGGEPPASIVEATYSLGWCRLYGMGIEANHQEAIRLLTSISKTHAGACYTLGICHEEGMGVVVADDREAVKFYRKAQKFGHPSASAKVAELERKLRTRTGV